jgi:predicted site-specific integrase-resolvase
MLSNPTTHEGDETWLPIVDYAVLKGVSTSTLRRYIKANKVRFKLENGRYLLPASESIKVAHRWDEVGSDSVAEFDRSQELEEQLRKAQEQISELKMLVAIYEEKLAGWAR